MEEVVAMSLDPTYPPRLKAETTIFDQHGDVLGIIDGFFWPRDGAIVELGNPNRDAVVREVRLRIEPGWALIRVEVYDRGEIVPPMSDAGDTLPLPPPRPSGSGAGQ